MSSKSTKSTLTFPLIKNKEIIACMRGLEIPLTMDDIKNPTQQKMKEICEGFLMHFMGLSREELRMPIFSATTKNIFEFRQLHEDSVYEFSTYFFMMRLMSKVGLKNPSIRDILFPTYQKTKRILSALINFARFRGEKLPLFQDHCEETENFREECQKIRDANAELEAKLDEYKEQFAKDEPEIKRLQEETATLAETINTLNIKHDSLRREVKKLKKEELKKIQDDIFERRFLFQQAKEKTEDLKSKIVESPEEVQKKLADMTASIETNKTKLEEKAETLRELQAKVALLTKVQGKINKRMAKMSETQGHIKRAKGLQSEIKEVSAGAQENKENVESLNRSTDQINMQISEYQQKLYELQGQRDQKLHDENKLLEEAMKKKMEMMRTSAADKAKLDSNHHAYKTRVHELELAKKAHAQKMRQIQGSYSKLMTTVGDYHEHLRSVIHTA